MCSKRGVTLTVLLMVAVLSCAVHAGPMDWTITPTDPVMGLPNNDIGIGLSCLKVGELYRCWHDDGLGNPNQTNVMCTTSTNGINWEPSYLCHDVPHDAHTEVVLCDGTYYLWVGAGGCPIRS